MTNQEREEFEAMHIMATRGVVPCEDCGGSGEVGEEIHQGEFQPPERDRCSSCDGSGRWEVDVYSADQVRQAVEAGRAAERAEWVRDVGAMRSLHFAHILRRQFTSDVGRWKVQDSEATVDARLASASGESAA